MLDIETRPPIDVRQFRSNMQDMRSEMHAGFEAANHVSARPAHHADLRSEFATFRREIEIEIAALRQDLTDDIAALRQDLKALISTWQRKIILWNVGTMIVLTGLVFSITRFVH